MATQYFGTWAPSNGFLPIITDTEIKFAAYYVTEPGTYNSISYAIGDWLIFIDDSSENKWFKSSGGIVSFNLSTGTVCPAPGTYTKFILGQSGNIVEATTLDKDDIPSHTHDLSDIDTSSMSPVIYSIIKSIFLNNENNLVKFNYDDKLKKVTADIRIDELSIKKNADGQLYSDGTFTDEDGNEIPGSGSGGNPVDVSITIDDVESLSDTIKKLQAQILLNKILTSGTSAISLVEKSGGTYADVRFDGLSVIKNDEGELCVNPDLLAVYTINGLNVTTNPDGSTTGTVGGTCGNFTITTEDITDLDTYVEKKLVEYAKLFTVSADALPIDEDTIIINSEGKLSAVFSKTQPHKHVLDDITDFPKQYLQYASLQIIHQDAANPIDLSDGKFIIEGHTIGSILDVYNQEFISIDKEIASLKALAGKVEPGEPLHIDCVSISITSDDIDVYDTETNKQVTAFYNYIKTNVSEKFYPTNKGIIDVLIDDIIVSSFALSDSINLGTSQNGISIEKYEDYYKEIPGFTGTYKGIAISYLNNEITEGTHTIKYRHTIDSTTYETKSFTFNFVVASAPMISSLQIEMPKMNTQVSGVWAANNNTGSNIIAKISNAMTKKYVPINLGYIIYNDPTSAKSTSEQIIYKSISSNVITSNTFEIKIPNEFSGNIIVNATCKNVFGVETDSRKAVSDFVRFDFSTVESYRYIYVSDDSNDYPPDDIVSPVLEKYDSSKSLVGTDIRYIKELQILDDIAQFKYADYTNFNSPSYSILETTNCEGSQVRWITLLIPCNKKIFNGYFDLYNIIDESFTKNINGTLKNIFIWISPVDSSTMIANDWINANKSFTGKSTFTNQNKNYAGLDLSRSGTYRRWFTFGRQPLNMVYDSLAFRIALAKGESLNIKKFITSIEESINGQL